MLLVNLLNLIRSHLLNTFPESINTFKSLFFFKSQIPEEGSTFYILLNHNLRHDSSALLYCKERRIVKRGGGGGKRGILFSSFHGTINQLEFLAVTGQGQNGIRLLKGTFK